MVEGCINRAWCFSAKSGECIKISISFFCILQKLTSKRQVEDKSDVLFKFSVQTQSCL